MTMAKKIDYAFHPGLDLSYTPERRSFVSRATRAKRQLDAQSTRDVRRRRKLGHKYPSTPDAAVGSHRRHAAEIGGGAGEGTSVSRFFNAQPYADEYLISYCKSWCLYAQSCQLSRLQLHG
jgi:hypothetical protein